MKKPEHKMSFREFLYNTISEGKNPSSKRVAGVLGWIICLAAAIVALIRPIPSPDIIEMLFWSSCAMLGIDSVTGAFKKRNPFKKIPTNTNQYTDNVDHYDNIEKEYKLDEPYRTQKKDDY